MFMCMLHVHLDNSDYTDVASKGTMVMCTPILKSDDEIYLGVGESMNRNASAVFIISHATNPNYHEWERTEYIYEGAVEESPLDAVHTASSLQFAYHVQLCQFTTIIGLWSADLKIRLKVVMW